MPAKGISSPKFCIHKPTGQAYINVDGKRQYLGRHDDPDTIQKYHTTCRKPTVEHQRRLAGRSAI